VARRSDQKSPTFTTLKDSSHHLTGQSTRCGRRDRTHLGLARSRLRKRAENTRDQHAWLRGYHRDVRLRALVLGSAVLVATVAACGSRGEATSTSRSYQPGTVPSRERQAAVARVLASPQGSGLGFFPRGSLSEPCVIPGGGPAPGLRIRGTCATQVAFRRGFSRQMVVTFTERWPWRAFRGVDRRAVNSGTHGASSC